MKRIKFSVELTKLVLDGTKTSTFRLFDDKNLSSGDKVILSTRDGANITDFAIGSITEVLHKTIETLTESDYIGHEPLENPLQVFRKFYGDKVNPNTALKVVRFKVEKLI